MKKFLKNVFSTMVGMLIGSFLCFVIIAAVIVYAIQGASRGGAHDPIEDKSILHLRLRGQLVEKHRPLDFDFIGDRSIFSESRLLGLWEINRAIELAKTDKRVEGIYVEARDFEAGWAAINALKRQLENFAQSGKWIYFYADSYDEMTMYLASAANRTFIQPHGAIEFNGLGVSEAFLKGLLEKLDLEPRIFRSGKFKAAIEPLILDAMSDENRQQTQELVNGIWSVIRQSIEKTRKLKPGRVDAIASQLEAVSAGEAISTGLIHEAIFEDELEDRMRESTVGKDEELRYVSALDLIRDKGEEVSSSQKKIALIFAEGEIHSGPGGRDSIGSESLRQDILDAVADDEVAAIVLRVNSPGGDALASDVIWRELMAADQDIPVVVSMGDLAASGGYYIASGGRYIFAEPTTITGSIGVFGVLFNSEKFFRNKTGIRFDRVVTHPHADLGNPNRPMTEFEASSIQRDVDRVYNRFLDVVQESRGYEKRADVERIAEGRVWSGVRAKELGLIDELGGLDLAIAKARDYAKLDPDTPVEIFPKDLDPLKRFIERFGGDTMEMIIDRFPLLSHGMQEFKAVNHKIPSTALSGTTSSADLRRVQARLLFDLKIR
jgi:protease-4